MHVRSTHYISIANHLYPPPTTATKRQQQSNLIHPYGIPKCNRGCQLDSSPRMLIQWSFPDRLCMRFTFSSLSIYKWVHKHTIPTSSRRRRHQKCPLAVDDNIPTVSCLCLSRPRIVIKLGIEMDYIDDDSTEIIDFRPQIEERKCRDCVSMTSPLSSQSLARSFRNKHTRLPQASQKSAINLYVDQFQNEEIVFKADRLCALFSHRLSQIWCKL